MKLAPPSSLCTSEVRWDLGGAFFALFVFCPPGPTAVGSGGPFCVILIHFSAAPIYYFLKLYHGVTLYAITVTSGPVLRHCTRLEYSVAVSYGVGPELPISDCAAVLSSGSIRCA